MSQRSPIHKSPSSSKRSVGKMTRRSTRTRRPLSQRGLGPWHALCSIGGWTRRQALELGTRQGECLVASQYIAQTPSANGFPLLIKGLLESGVTRAPEQEIVSANQNRLTYWKFAERVGRLASGLASLGGRAGRYGGNHGLGYPSVSGVFLRGANDGRGAAYRERPPFGRANSLHDQSRRG